MDRALRANVITKSGKAVETAGDMDTLLLDKTGTITIGNRKAPISGRQLVLTKELSLKLAALSSLADETPEGKSIIELASNKISSTLQYTTDARFIKFTAETRSSGIDLPMVYADP